MSDVKKALLKEIDKKIKKQQDIRAEKASAIVVNTFVMTYIKNIEDVNAMVTNPEEWQRLTERAAEAFTESLRGLDYRVSWTPSWIEDENNLPRINHVVISWSKVCKDKEKRGTEQMIDAATCFIDSLT